MNSNIYQMTFFQEATSALCSFLGGCLNDFWETQLKFEINTKTNLYLLDVCCMCIKKMCLHIVQAVYIGEKAQSPHNTLVAKQQ